MGDWERQGKRGEGMREGSRAYWASRGGREEGSGTAALVVEKAVFAGGGLAAAGMVVVGRASGKGDWRRPEGWHVRTA